MTAHEIPARLQLLTAAPGGVEWLETLPETIDRALARFEVEVAAPYPSANVSWVAPVRLGNGSGAVLKIPFPHRESRHETAALRVWGGAGAIRLLADAPDLGAFLVERCDPGTPLSQRPVAEALDVMSGLLPRLLVATDGPYDHLTGEARRWRESLRLHRGRYPEALTGRVWDRIDEWLAAAAPTGDEALVSQDLHADNVVSSGRGWLAIDPKPLIAERAFAAVAIVRGAELGHERRAVLHRLSRFAGDLGVDPDRLRLWTAAHTAAWGFGHTGPIPGHVDVVGWLLTP